MFLVEWNVPRADLTLLWALRYATIYTMFPVFSLVLDQDVKPDMAMLYPELYKDLTKVWARPAPPAPRRHSTPGVPQEHLP